jgi:hypothetical protein
MNSNKGEMIMSLHLAMPYDKLDVIVVGGGPSGVVASIAAARQGVKVLLIDLNGFLGGVSTAANISSFLTFHNMRGEQIAKGIAQEIVDRLLAYGGAIHPGHLRNPYGNAYSVTPFDAEILKFVLMEMTKEAGVIVLLRTMYISPIMFEGKIRGVVAANKGGINMFPANVVIDCSGDADVAYHCGVPYQKGDEIDGRTMPMTLAFRLGNVNTSDLVSYVKAHPDQFLLAEDPYIKETPEEIAKRIHTFSDIPLLTGFFDLIKQKKELNEFPSTRERLILEITPQEGVVDVNTTNVLGKDGTNPSDLTEAYNEALVQVRVLVNFFRNYVPGFENSHLVDTASVIGVRETRRVIGEYVLKGEDVIKGREHADGIGKAAYCIDVHESDGTIRHRHIEDGKAYDIPYRSLIPLIVDNLLVAGRAISMDREASGSARNQVPCMVTGQAAGTAAALCKKLGTVPRELNTDLLRETLSENGVVL